MTTLAKPVLHDSEARLADGMTPAELIPRDFSVIPDPAGTTCTTVRFYVKLTPSPLDSAAAAHPVGVRVLVHDVYGNYEFRDLTMSSHGETRSLQVDLPWPATGVTPGGWTREFFLVVDPERRHKERTERNNFATVEGSCPLD